MMGKKSRKILETVEKILKRQDKMMEVVAGQPVKDEAQEAALRRLEQIAESVSSHDLALTDLLDSWEEIQEAHQQETVQLRRERDSALMAELSRAENRENELLKLEIDTLDQLFYLRRAAEDAPEWQEQLKMIQNHLAMKQRLAGLIEISEKDISVNYDVHEVVEVRGIDDPAKDAAIAEILQTGYIYQGNVIRKAKVAAWKYMEEED